MDETRSLLRPRGADRPGGGSPWPEITDPATLQRAELLLRHIRAEIGRAGGWLSFDRYMESALYTPGLGYYAAADGVLGAWGTGSDFITAPELSPLFARALARQVLEAAQRANVDRVVEFGAGSARLACELLPALQAGGWLPEQYVIVEVSAGMRARQQQAVSQLPQPLRERVVWWDTLPERFDAVVVGNEVLDAMPVRLLRRAEQGWEQLGVVDTGDDASPLDWQARPFDGPLPRPSLEQLPVGAVTEIHEAAEGFIATLGAHLGAGLVLLVDYGFPAREYDHPQRAAGTLRCHRAHRVHDAPLWQPGLSDITSHVEFSGIARAGALAGLDLLGYTSQARFLLNCGILDLLSQSFGAAGAAPTDRAMLQDAAAAQKLLGEHEMGELFKVIALGRGLSGPLLGFAAGDRSAALTGTPGARSS